MKIIMVNAKDAKMDVLIVILQVIAIVARSLLKIIMTVAVHAHKEHFLNSILITT